MNILKLIRCRLFNRHDAIRFKERTQKHYRSQWKGDYGDIYGSCKDCHKLVHGDFHVYGDAIWRRL